MVEIQKGQIFTKQKGVALMLNSIEHTNIFLLIIIAQLAYIAAKIKR